MPVGKRIVLDATDAGRGGGDLQNASRLRQRGCGLYHVDGRLRGPESDSSREKPVQPQPKFTYSGLGMQAPPAFFRPPSRTFSGRDIRLRNAPQPYAA